jgi:hypothetical protein
MTGISFLRVGMRLCAAGQGRTDLALPKHDVIVAERCRAVNRDMAAVPVSGSAPLDGKQDSAISASKAVNILCLTSPAVIRVAANAPSSSFLCPDTRPSATVYPPLLPQ